MNYPDPTKEQLAITRAVVLMQALAETLDDLKRTKAYRQSLKNRLNLLEQDLSVYLNTLSVAFWGEDEELMMQISRGIDAVTSALATWHPAQMAVLEDVLNQIEEQFNQTQNEISETTEQTGH
jgi:predicted  nucleic acid-binding Zn-ribbon protein